MQTEERQREIVALAHREGHANVERLAATFSVPRETIWQDLALLERQGLLRRVHGGAIPLRRLGFEPDLPTRGEFMEAEKQRIAQAALAEVPAEGAILLDAGSTTSRLAELLPGGRELTVITNSLPIAQLLAAQPGLTVITLGGRVRARTLAEVDVIAIRTLNSFRIDVSFLATNGVSVDHGLTTPDLAEAEVKRAMCQRARRRVLLTDSSKIGNDSFCRFADLRDLDVVVTDTSMEDEAAAEFTAAGPRVMRV
ncbi:DeoR/GlpR family DNA-binding transcription regulator [Streptomyces sp.]|uniref:DeoR/GlpR family DNA-binding transcription regulator n=1 Tax=Streptomyces sp. TaxID=1931 RepID=UPI002F3FFE19